MANAAADQALRDQLTEAFSVNTTQVVINVTDTGITFNSKQVDTATPADLVHTLTIKTKSETLIEALADALVTEGRP